MLVLTRKLQEQIRIGDNVTITVLRVKGQAVRIGIDAPREVRVVRAELPRDGKDLSTPDAPPADATRDSAATATESGGKTSSEAGNDPSASAACARRLPQRRLFNRYGRPPLRLASVRALASATA